MRFRSVCECRPRAIEPEKTFRYFETVRGLVVGRHICNPAAAAIWVCAISIFPMSRESYAQDVRHQTCREGFFEEVYIPPGRTKIYNPPLVSQVAEADGVVVTTNGFCVSVNEVSVSEYHRCVEFGACNEVGDANAHPDHPVRSLSINQVREFLRWVSAESGQTYRLPTEAEWQYAALGGMLETYPWRFIYDKPQPNIFSDGIRKTGVSAPNGFGLRDAIGNLAEYVSDCYTEKLKLIPRDGLPYVESECQ